MKIGIVSIIREPWGGSEELWAALAKEAMLLGHSIVISAYDCGTVSPKTKSLVEQGAILDLRLGKISNKLSFWKYLQRRVKRAYSKILGNPYSRFFSYNPDIVLYAGTSYSILSDKKLLTGEKPLFINIQLNNEITENLLSRNEKKIIADAYKKARIIFFVSERNKIVAEKQLGIKIENALIVRNPVNIASTHVVPFPKTEIFHVAMVGNLVTRHKGQDIALDVLSKEIWSKRNWHLNIYGEGEDRQLLEQMVAEKQLSHRVTFHGKVSDIRQVWATNHILLMPSRMEGMPLAVVEAMICGRPSVVTDVGGHTEWIEEEKEGWIAAKPNTESFAAAMERAWTSREQWEKIGLQAHHKAMSLYDPQPGKTLLNYILNSLKK